jgi:Arc/MetJ family transcription regulator
MRISVDIEDAVLEEVMALTGEKNKSPALSKAVTEFVRRRRAREFGRLIREGAFDYPDPVGSEGDTSHPVPALLKA